MVAKTYISIEEACVHLACDKESLRQLLIGKVVPLYVELDDCTLVWATTTTDCEATDNIARELRRGTDKGVEWFAAYIPPRSKEEVPTDAYAVSGWAKLSRDSAKKLLRVGSIASPNFIVSLPDTDRQLVLKPYRENRPDAFVTTLDALAFPNFMRLDRVRICWDDIEDLAPKPQPAQDATPNYEGEMFASQMLATLNLAARTLWANAKRDDRSTHPTNDQVADWLFTRGYSRTLAEKAATIIRPEWAPTGRRPEE